MKRVVCFLLMAVIALPLVFSCNRAPEVPDPEAGLAPFPKPSEQVDEVPLTRSERDFVQAGNDFAWRLTRKVWEANQERKGIILSPLSVQYALGMLGNGADAQVAAKLAEVLGYEGTDAINAFCSKMIECLPAVDTSVTLALANGVLVNDKCTLKAPFKAAVEGCYDALVESMSFDNPNAVKKYVNDWCYKHTFGRITDVLEDVDPLSFMYLMNAIYFNARWTNPFDKSKTKSENFKTLSGQNIKVGMMHAEIKETYYYSETESCQIMTLPYGRGKYSMTIFLPKETDGVAALLEDRGKYTYSGLSNVKLSLPSFRTDYKIDMKSLLAGMGLPLGPYNELVENAAGTPPEISKVIHQANITVNETGSEAAAVAVVEMRYGASGIEPPKPRDVTFTADHPFLYTITENTSGAILFTGVYTGN